MPCRLPPTTLTESLETDPPHVAILGVLTGDAGEDIEQLIVDPRLAPASARESAIRRLILNPPSPNGVE